MKILETYQIAVWLTVFSFCWQKKFLVFISFSETALLRNSKQDSFTHLQVVSLKEELIGR